MRLLYHLWLSPSCRAVRLSLTEKSLPFDMQVEKIWERRETFLALNPAGEVPVLREPDEGLVIGGYAILEYLEDAYPECDLLGKIAAARPEVRRLAEWFDRKFDREVTQNLVGEKIMKRFLGLGEPSSAAIRAGHQNIHYHLDYIGYLVEHRNWLAGSEFSLADIMAGAHLSCLDYLGDVPWDDHPIARTWYARLKSRPSFRPLLEDHIPGAPPPKHYADLDF